MNQEAKTNETQRKQHDWKHVKTLSDGALEVRVNRNVAVPWPDFSFEVVTNLEGRDRLSHHIRARVNRVSLGRVEMGDSMARTVALIEEAEGYILSEANELEKQRCDSIVERDLQRAKYSPGERAKREVEPNAKRKSGKRKAKQAEE